MVNPFNNVELQTKTIDRRPSSLGNEKGQAEGSLGLDEEETALFTQYQPLVTKIVYKFSYIGGHKKTECAWKYYLGLEFKAVEINDLYQIGKMVLMEAIRKIKNKKIKNVCAYLFKVLYRQLKHHITKQAEFINLDPVYEERGEPEDPYSMEDAIAYRELKNILGAILDNLDEREKYVIESLYGLNNTEIKSKAEIGKSLGMCSQRVQSLHTSSIRRIRKNKRVLARLEPFLH
jgi:RNA polymerase sigma factor (sigma-70 family)